MKDLFEIEWCGGAAERHFRKLRPMSPDIPWGTLDPTRYPPLLVDRARMAWTGIAHTEYRAAAAFADVLAALLAAKAPLDLIGMAGDFIADEAFHVELASRLATEIGGGVPLEVDFAQMGPKVSKDLDQRQRANELVLRVACISETLSGAIAVETMREVDHPLVAAITEQIARDEARHARLGWLYFEWAAADLSDDERARLAQVARREIAQLPPLWRRPSSKPADGVTGDGHRIEDVRDLGWMESNRLVEVVQRTIKEEIVAPLANVGIDIDLAHAANS